MLVVSGPSGVGKSTVIAHLRHRQSLRFSISATTRRPRPGETPGVDYEFVDRDLFSTMLERGEFLEWARYSDDLYGTPRGPIEQWLEAGEDVLLDIENAGAVQVKKAFPDAITVFIMPPTMTDLERRLLSRGDTSQEEIQRRLAVAVEQISHAEEAYDHLVANDEVETAAERIQRILVAPDNDEER